MLLDTHILTHPTECIKSNWLTNSESFLKLSRLSTIYLKVLLCILHNMCVYIYMGLSENSVPLHPMVLLIIIPFLNGYFIGNIPNIFRQTHVNIASPLTKTWDPWDHARNESGSTDGVLVAEAKCLSQTTKKIYQRCVKTHITYSIYIDIYIYTYII